MAEPRPRHGQRPRPHPLNAGAATGPGLAPGDDDPIIPQVNGFVADAEAIYSYEGTREMNTLIVGRAITGLSAFT